jgi:mono/diheme cytochrome c family protein
MPCSATVKALDAHDLSIVIEWEDAQVNASGKISAGLCGALAVLAIAMASPSMAGDVAPDSGAAAFEAACTQCHLASQATAQSKTSEQWAQTVDQMIAYGAEVSDEQYAQIVHYLSTNYGPSATPAQ